MVRLCFKPSQLTLSLRDKSVVSARRFYSSGGELPPRKSYNHLHYTNFSYGGNAILEIKVISIVMIGNVPKDVFSFLFF